MSDVSLLSCSSNALDRLAHLQSNMSFDVFVYLVKYMYILSNVFVYIVKCICISCQLYLYILSNVFVYLVKCICLFCQIFCIMICLRSTHIDHLSVTSPVYCYQTDSGHRFNRHPNHFQKIEQICQTVKEKNFEGGGGHYTHLGTRLQF